MVGRSGFMPDLARDIRYLARAVLPLLKPGGRFVYSTCSIEPQENSEVVTSLLEERPNLRMLEEVALLPAAGHDGGYSAALEALSPS